MEGGNPGKVQDMESEEKALKNTRKISPANLKVPGNTEKYNPIAAHSAPIHRYAPLRVPNRAPIRGTRTTYKPVMNPAFPAVVYTMPTCWRLDPPNKRTPAVRPLFKRLKRPEEWIDFSDPCGRNRLGRISRGRRDRAPSANRIPLNPKGLTCSIPAR